MDPEGEDWLPVIEKLTLLKRGWPSPTWTWDARFTMIASSFDKAVEAAARASAVHALPYAWDSQSLSTAPAGLRELCQRTGGLRAKQMLMAGRAGPLVLVGLWWPWGDGKTITLRLGLGEHGAAEEPYPQVRTLFGVDMR
jgi:hypothetical protein